mmetsp:Transcript_27512/g.88884  ORF Transcript_27512/g.88884 Transcript_27512/m.88884 type:complete len:295 (+) Transcript_27512:540-1424(+)
MGFEKVAASRAFLSSSAAGCMYLEWKAPETGWTMVFDLSTFMSLMVVSSLASSSLGPERTRPLGKSWFAMETFGVMMSVSCWSSRPMTVIIPVGTSDESQALPMASPRSLSSLTAVFKSKTPAKARAVYSPREKPAQASALAMASGSSAWSFLTAARDVRKTHACENRVSFSFSAGPSWMIFKRSSPSKTDDARSNIALTPGASRYGAIIPTFWAPCPGNKKTCPFDVGSSNNSKGDPSRGIMTCFFFLSPPLELRNLAVHQPSIAVQVQEEAVAYRPILARRDPFLFVFVSAT